MGQYWIPVNLDKREYVDPHKLGCGLKLWEQLANHPGTGTALIILCAAMPEPRGGGDLAKASIIGRWAGDRIAFVGDYAVDGDLPAQFEASTIFGRCGDPSPDNPTMASKRYTDVTDQVCAVIERELQGTFQGDGWRHFVRNGE